MKPRLIALLFTGLILLVSKVNGQDIEGTLLFEIKNPTNNTVSYLFGTNHSFGKSFFEDLDGVYSKLMSCDLVIKETKDGEGYKTSKDIINVRTKNTRWHKYLNRKNLHYVDALFENSDTQLSKMTPAELHTVLSRFYHINVCENRTPDDPNMTLDDYMAKLAQQHGKQKIGLETVEEQIAYINADIKGMPPKIHRKRLNDLTDRIRTKDKSACAFTKKYAAMQLGFHYDRKCTNEVLIINRNKKWMEVIPDYLNNHNCFIVVGLEHLRYECGLIVQLKKLGYKITPVKHI